MKKISTLVKAVADANRLRIIGALLSYDELCACQLTEFLQVSGATTSRHLTVLSSATLLTSRKEGRWIYYRLNREKPEVNDLIVWIKNQLHKDCCWQEEHQKLEKLLQIDPEELCRNQRGEKCCPR